METLPLSELRARLADALDTIEANGKPILISRRNRPAGVLMSAASYKRLVGEQAGFTARLARWRAEYADVFADDGGFDVPRDASPGRDFSW